MIAFSLVFRFDDAHGCLAQDVPVKGRAVIRTIFSFHGSGALIHNGDEPRAVDGLCGGFGQN